MKHVISIGGGIASTWLLVDRVISKYGKENVFPVICEIANEHPDLWRLVEAVENKYGIIVERIHIGSKPPDIWDIYFFTGIMGNNLVDPCSRMGKREKMLSHMKLNYNPADTLLHVGITAGEIDRMMAIQSNWTRNGYQVEADLADDPEIDKSVLLDMCRNEFGFIPQPYIWNPKGHNNCGMFCIKAGHNQMARLLWYDRKTFIYHETMELLHQQIFGHQNTIMVDRKTVKGIQIKTPLTLRDFRLRMEMKWRLMLPGFDPFDGLDETPGCRHCDSAG